MLNKISFSNARGDLFGGVTAAIVSLPLALAFGVASGAGPEAGLYGAILVGFFAALFGGTATLISEPTGPMTVVMTAVISSLLAQNPEQGMAMAFTVVMLAGVFQILFGALKLGKYVTLMPYSVVSGFMSGIGIILIVLQLPPFLGHASPPGGVVGTLTELGGLFTAVVGEELALAMGALAILFLIPARWKRYVPPQLVALVVVTAISVLFLGDSTIRRVGEIEVGLPSVHWPTFTQEQLGLMLVNGAVLGMLGCIDSLLTSVIADNLTRTEHSSDKELIGQGIGNMVSGLFGGLAGAGATMGTVVSIQAGAKTVLSGVCRAVILAAVVLVAAGLTSQIPLALLAAIAIKVGIDILDWSFLKRVHKVSWQSTLVMYAVMLLTVFVDLIVAVGIGVFVANVLIIEKLTRVQVEQIKVVSDVDDAVPLSREERELMLAAHGQTLLVYLSGSLIFGVSKALAREHTAMANYSNIVIDLTDVSLLDDTMSLSIENTVRDLVDASKQVFLVIPGGKPELKLQRTEVKNLIPEEHCVDTRKEALALSLSSV